MLSEGPLGPSLLVEDKTSGDTCVVKQVECTDYTQALLAYNQVHWRLLASCRISMSGVFQALQLQKLGSHPSVCRYRHFFVHWDRQVSQCVGPVEQVSLSL